MRRTHLVPVLLLLAIGVLGFAAPSDAGDDDAQRALRDAKRREADLQHKLQAALVRADTNAKRTAHLMRFVEDLMGKLADSRDAQGPAFDALRAKVKRLQAEQTRLQEALTHEQERHTRDVEALRAELVRAVAEADDRRLQVMRERLAIEIAEERLRFAKQELERLQWVYAKEAPAGSVARSFTDVPAAHWRNELESGETLRARVALQMLAVLPSRQPDVIDAILRAVSHERSLLDRATVPLQRIGAPAVQPLVAAACGEDETLTLDRGWVMHVLGGMGADAKDALPWLEEVATGEGRKADQARRAILKIREKLR